MPHETIGTPLSPSYLAEQLGVSAEELLELAGVAGGALGAHTTSDKVDCALRPIEQILSLLVEMAGDVSRGAIWFKHQPIPAWGGRTAYDLVRKGKADAVLRYLEHVQAGGYA